MQDAHANRNGQSEDRPEAKQGQIGFICQGSGAAENFIRAHLFNPR